MTPDQQRQSRLKGRIDIADSDAVPPPELGIDPRLERAFPEQAEEIRRYNESMRRWWRDTVVKQTKE